MYKFNIIWYSGLGMLNMFKAVNIEKDMRSWKNFYYARFPLSNIWCLIDVRLEYSISLLYVLWFETQYPSNVCLGEQANS